MISHLSMDACAAAMDGIGAAYHEALTAAAVASKDKRQCASDADRDALPTVAEVKAEMVKGGFERWVWLEAYMGTMGEYIPMNFQQHFHDQMLGWAKLHGITPATVGMPRP